MATERAATLASLRQVTAGGEINMQTLNDTLRYVGNLEMTMATVKNEEEKLRQAAEGARLEFVGARRDKRAVELLKDKRREAYRYAADRERQLELDEVALRVLHGHR